MSGKTFKISGVPVLFPGKPYPSQFCMMDRIIKGIERRQHCLLESPTGSGKSLALLCSALAWLREEKAKKEQEDSAKATCVCVCHVPDTVPKSKDESPVAPPKQIPDLDEDIVIKDDDEDDFKKDGLNFNTKSSDKKSPKKHISIAYESEEKKSLNESGSIDCKQCSCGSSSNIHVNRKIPKIFFGTRTHKQVSQIVRELGKTEYRDVNMTILGSREHTCIHPVVSKSKGKNEGCKELINGPGCPFRDRTQRYSSHKVIKGQGLSSAWDLEDLVAFCKPKKVCPFFLSRDLKEDADLVICPYNYLVDPLIREAMSLSLKGVVVILDEAHNIEDSAREAASQTIPQEDLTAAIKDMEELMQSHNLAEYSRLVYVLRNLDNFVEENKNSLEQKEFNQSYKIWNGFHIVAQLEGMGMGPKHFSNLKKALSQIRNDAEERKEESVRKGLSDNGEMKPATLTTLEQLFVVMDFLYRKDLKYADDYRASLVHSVNYVPRSEENQWLSSRNRNGGRKMVQVDVINLNFWCMNPAVAFSDFVDTRSVILTSGTLSPMTSFQSELGLDFKIQLEANHVIKDSQVWVGSLGQGPNGTGLMAVYRNLESFTFQDELGQVVLQVCKTVPNGVLCFLPSYKVLDKLYTRWESTGLLDKLSERKKVLREPRSSSKEDFEQQIISYYKAVECSNDPESNIDGAIMFAVCRGKISEGLDFADDFARAVISVGIPYPNFKDIQVDLKRKYNDQHRQDRGLMSGSDWYEIQAFRALNQALGRCIRHRNDWGALIVIDERFVKSAQKYTKGLSKWVRNKMCTHENYSRGMDSLREFILLRKKEEKEQPNTSEGLSIPPTTPKAFSCHTSTDAIDNCCEAPGKIDNSANFQGLKKADTPKTGSPNLRQYSIFNMGKAQPKPSTKYPKLSSISSPSPRNVPSSNSVSSTAHHQLPTAIVHPSFVLPPKPLASVPNNLNQLTGGNSVIKISAGNPTQHVNETTSFESIPNHVFSNKSKTSLRIITELAPPGTRMQVYEIDTSLHDVFGGNLNLPVSSTDRLVYIVDPPKTPGGNPLARIIKMPKEEKEKLAKADEELIRQQKRDINIITLEQLAVQQSESTNVSEIKNPSTTLSNNLPPQTASSSVDQTLRILPQNTSLCSSDTDRPQLDCQNKPSTITNCDKELQLKTLCSTSNLKMRQSPAVLSKSCVNKEGALNSMEEEPNSSCSLFDSPKDDSQNNNTNILPNTKSHDEKSFITSDNGLTGHEGKSLPTNNSTSKKSSNKNPLLKFFTSKKDSAETALSSPNFCENVGNRNTSNNSSPPEASPDMFQSGENPALKDLNSVKDLETSNTRKPLFKINNKNSSSFNIMKNNEKNDLYSSGDNTDTKLDATIDTDNDTEIKAVNVRHSASMSLESSPLDSKAEKSDSEEEGELSLKVQRKCGRKRRSLSTKKCHSNDSKKWKSGD